MKKKIKFIITFLVILIFFITFLIFFQNNTELRTIKSDKELTRIYNGDDSDSHHIFSSIFTLPFSFIYDIVFYNRVSDTGAASDNIDVNSTYDTVSKSSIESTSSKDYSTTNIQVENVDEADITKTDGDYIYSISDDNVIITNVMDPENIQIQATIESDDGSIPEDLILYQDKLVVIATKSNSTSSYFYQNHTSNTIVKIYDIENKSNPILVKSYELYERYYTSRCIDNKLYVIASGNLREKDDKVIRTYKEDNIEQEIALNDIKYLKDVETTKQTIFSLVDLDNASEDIDISSYLIDISNAYVSENSIYLLDQKYDYDYDISIRNVFGLYGILGAFQDDIYSRGITTEIYKFNISEDGSITYKNKSKVAGKTINQYSLDEQNGHLRVALYNSDGTRIVIFDEHLNQIGSSDSVAEGEQMYSSRFIGNKAYLVTYKNTDPLFVIDLSDESKPKVLGELHIPGYSTYLHPYDENHLIGIGMETEESITKNSSGKVTSSTTRIVGMKMALFDVSDVNNPVQLSQTIIGDRRTTSAILTNPKALLFSKEKQLIAIPVNNYSEDFEVDASNSSNSSMVNAYANYRKIVCCRRLFSI